MAKNVVTAQKPEEEKQTGQLAVITPPAPLAAIPPGGGVAVYDDIESDGDTGLEGVTTKERRIPIMRILDPKSPQCKPVERGGIPGAKGGSILNTSTGQIYEGNRGLYLVPAHRTHKYVKFKKRAEDGSGGGFVSIHEPDDPAVMQASNDAVAKYGDTFRKLAAGIDDEGNDLEFVETYYIGGLLIVPNPDGSFPGEYGEVFPALVPFSSTNIPVYSAFIDRSMNMKYPVQRNGKIEQVTPKLYAHVWHLRSNYFERGAQSWYKWQMSLASKADDGTENPFPFSRLGTGSPLYQEAAKIRQAMIEGSAEVDYAKDTAQGDMSGQTTTSNRMDDRRGIDEMRDDY